MKFLILLVFCFGVKADVPETSTNSCGFEIISKTYGVGLRDNENDVTNNDNIIEPCDSDDYDCMREFMAVNSNCKAAYGPVPDPLYIAQSTLYFPNSGLKFTFAKTTATGLSDASVISFYYNKKTKVLVFAIQILALALDIQKLFITYRRPGLESICKSDYANATYRSLIFTASIPKIGGKLRLDLADAKFGFVGDAYLDFDYGSNSYTSTDPTATADYARFLETVALNRRIVFLFTSELYAALYIQTYICNFGVKLYST